MTSEMVRINLRRFAVENSFVEMTLKVLNAFYDHLNATSPQIVDLHLFGRSSSMNAFLGREKLRLGIRTSDLDSSFFAMHDAFQGIPRVAVAQDKMLELPRLVGVGVLHHEAGHTVLHGSLEFYMFPVPLRFINLERKRVIPKQLSMDLLYLASVAAKDYEVTRFLLRKGYVEDQVAYNKYLLETSEEDREVWDTTNANEWFRLKYLVSLLKPVLCATPLLDDEKYGKAVAESIAISISHLDSDWRERLLEMVNVASGFRENTHENLALLMRKIVELCPAGI